VCLFLLHYNISEHSTANVLTLISVLVKGNGEVHPITGHVRTEEE